MRTILRISRRTTSISSRLFLLLLFGSRASSALNPEVAISQYAHTTWRVQDGAFEGTPNAITQTKDGYLWLGTSSGLFRFDGQHFTPVRLPASALSAQPVVLALFGAHDGSLWVGSNAAVFQWNHGAWQQSLPMAGRINAITESSDGVVWVAQTRTRGKAGGLCSVSSGTVRCFGQDQGFTGANAVAARSDGSIWAGSTSKILEWKDGRGTILSISGVNHADQLQAITSILTETDGSAWVGMVTIGAGQGLQRRSGTGSWSPYVAPGFDSSTISVSTLRKDHQGSLWIGTQGAGLYRLHHGAMSRYMRSDGLSSNGIIDSYEDHEGNMWFATAMGLDRFRNLPIVSYSDGEGLQEPSVDAVLAGRDGAVWISNGTGLNVLRNGKMDLLNRSNGLPGERVTSLLEDDRGRLWVGVDDKLAVYEAGHFRLIHRLNGSVIGAVGSMAEDTDHNVWIHVVGQRKPVLVEIDSSLTARDIPIPLQSGAHSLAADPRGGIWILSDAGVVAHYDQGKIQEIADAQSKTELHAQLIVSEASGALLASTSSGFIRWQNGVTRSFGNSNGMPCPTIYSLVESKQGSLWLYTQCGVVEITRAQMERWWSDPAIRLSLRLFAAQDGALPSAADFDPRAGESPDGRLWFASGTILQMVDPHQLERNLLQPPVYIEQFVANRKSYPAAPNLRLPKLTGDLEFDYTALSFVSSEKVRFKYKLEGFDTEWQEAGTRRQAFYTNLRPGRYIFHAIACNNDGVWNNAGDMLEMSIAPAYYQTMWFRFACVMSTLFAAWALFRLRLYQVMQTVRERLAGQVAERERIARELHDTFLQGLYAVLLRFQTIADGVPPDAPARKMMEDALHRADSVITQGRESLRGLRGELSAMLSIAEELEHLAEECSVDSEVVFTMAVAGLERTLHPVIRDEVVQIGKEAIFNSFRHSGAASLCVQICFDRAFFSVSVHDDGRGIDPRVLAAGGKSGHWGMLGMCERSRRIGAQFTISSSLRGGTEVKLRIPAMLAYTKRRGLMSWRKHVVFKNPLTELKH